MSTRIPALLASALLVAPLVAQAQTLNFYDSVSGISTTLLSGTLGPPDVLPLVTVPFSGTITGSITLDGSESATFNFTLNEQGGGGPGINAVNGFSLSAGFYSCGAGSYCGDEGYIDILTNAKGAITGAIANVNNAPYSYNSWGTAFMIGPTGVQGTFQGIIPGTYWDCQAADLTFSPTYPNGIYTGPNIKNCNVNVSSAQSGQWSVAPEIDPTSAASGIALLLGGLAVLRGRRGLPKTS
jgi:hypothetical protein